MYNMLKNTMLPVDFQYNGDFKVTTSHTWYNLSKNGEKQKKRIYLIDQLNP